MGNRLTQIATRTGDNGTTGLGNNQRVSKNSLRVHAMGEVDELNSNIGVLLCEDMPADVREVLVEVQHQLFNLGGELSIPGFELLKEEAVTALDDATTPSCPSSRNLSCPQAPEALRRPMSAVLWPAVPSAPVWLWATKSRSTTRPVSTSTACRI
jgi:Cobalamin adenosyltransferase